MPRLVLSDEANRQLDELENDPSRLKRLKAVRKGLGLIESNPRHPGLNTHKYRGLKGPDGVDVFEAYAENQTPGAYRIFWHYGPGRETITILTITPHP
jgi:hypothetical protein